LNKNIFSINKSNLNLAPNGDKVQICGICAGVHNDKLILP